MVRPTFAFLFSFFAFFCSQESSKPVANPVSDQLKRLFVSKVDVEKATGRVTLHYQFSKREQLEDFFLSDPSIKLQRGGGVHLPVGSILTHKALWDELKITATLLPHNPQGILVRTTDDIKLVLGKPTTSSNKIMILSGAKNISQQTYKLKEFSKKIIPIEWSIDEQKTSLNYGGLHLGSAFEKKMQSPKQLEFHAAKGDLDIGSIRVAGKLNADWVEKELSGQKTK